MVGESAYIPPDVDGRLEIRPDEHAALVDGRPLSLTMRELQLLTTLAGQVSVSLQNALLLRDRVAVARYEEELNLARQIQRASLLSEFPRMPRCEVHALYHPSKEVGGDFYDVVEDADGNYLIAIADVSGKGVPAALLSSMLQAALRTQAGATAPLPEILRNINALLYRSTSIHQFATFFLARIDPLTLRMTYSNAGHNWPVVIRANGERRFLDCGGTVLGIMDEIRFEQDEITLAPGDRVVCYTDGVSEATDRSGELFGEQRLYDFVSHLPAQLSARVVTERLLESVHSYLGGVEPQDDVTILVLRVLEPAEIVRDVAPEPKVELTGVPR